MSGAGKEASSFIVDAMRLGVYLLLVCTVAVGLWHLRAETIPAWERRATRIEILAKGAQARGPGTARDFREGERVYVSAFAPAQAPATRWVGLEQDTVLAVRRLWRDEAGEVWLIVVEEGAGSSLPLVLHASFAQRYEPVALGDGLEFSDCKVRRYDKVGGTYYSVSGRLRNSGTRTLSRCVVVCEFRGLRTWDIEQRESVPVDLLPGRFAEFETGHGRMEFSALRLRVRYVKDGIELESPEIVLNPRRLFHANQQSPN